MAQMMVALNIVISKFLLTTMPVLVLLEIRFLLASFILLPIHFIISDKRLPLYRYFTRTSKRQWYVILGQALSAGALFNCFMLIGLHYTDANLAGIITSALPAIITVLSCIILGEKISSKKAMCVLFATIGLVIIAYDQLHGTKVSSSFLGNLLVFLALLPEASYYILCKIHTNKMPVFLASFILNGINAIVLFPALLIINWEPSNISINNWIIIFIISISSGLFYIFWFLGSKKIDGVLASLTTAIMPIATVVFAWVLLNEQLSLLEAMGMLLVIFSIALYARR